MSNWVAIDGSTGAGGAQLLRAAMSLSLVTRRPVRIENIRANRPEPGLNNYHVSLLGAAASIAPGSKLRGDTPGSQTVEFEPAPTRPGRFNMDTSDAGSGGALLQMLALPLALSTGRSSIRIVGGIHNVGSPGYEFLDHVWSVWMSRCGLHIDPDLDAPGLSHGGTNAIVTRVQPAQVISPLNLTEAVKPIRIRIISLRTDDLPQGFERKQTNTLVASLRRHPDLTGALTDVERVEGQVRFRGLSGTQVFCVVDSAFGPAGFQHYGDRNNPERAAERVAEQVLEYLGSGATVDSKTADQLIAPLSLAKGPSSYTSPTLTQHMKSQIYVAQRFLPVRIQVTGDSPVRVDIEPF